ncbi:MAG TPA: ferritin-like domain-containing protein [Candidatus Binataceae bacterium]|nr:ferritin-like domain-containing protein [Candidatus Binataceae bacterium]
MANETSHTIPSTFQTCFQREYACQAPDLRRLYENAKRDQWNVSKDIDWSTPVDLDRGIVADELIDIHGSEFWNCLDAKRQTELNVEFSRWRISQLLHGEEGAMLACSQLVDMVPNNDAKFFQATQVVDEARHAEVLSRYLLDKTGGRVYPMAPNIKALFDFVLSTNKWPIKTVALQLIAETFAVSLFKMLAETSKDPLLRNICQRILSDEARHMGFSILSLPDEVRGFSGNELREAEDFLREALELLFTGMFPQAAYEAVGFGAADIERIRQLRRAAFKGNEFAYFRRLFRREMHTQLVTNIKRVGLMTERACGFLRELGIDPGLAVAA